MFRRRTTRKPHRPIALAYNHHLYPNVARVAKRYLCAPPTSVASERLFSSASRVITDRRNRLAPKKADMLLFIKHNLALINFKYWGLSVCITGTLCVISDRTMRRPNWLIELRTDITVFDIKLYWSLLCLTVHHRSKASAAALAAAAVISCGGGVGSLWSVSLRSAQQNTLVVPRYTLTTYGRRAFSVAGPTALNSLPVAFGDLTISDACFRRHLKTVLFTQQRRLHSV